MAPGAAAGAAERPLPEQTHKHLLNSAAAESRHTGAEVAAEAPHVKRQLLNGMHRDHPSAHPSVADSHPHTVPGLSTSAGASDMASQFKASNGITVNGAIQLERSLIPAAVDGVAQTAQTTAAVRHPVPAENGNLGTAQQQQGVTAQMNGIATQRAGPGSVKAFLNGIRPDPAPWDDVDPALAKDRAALNRYQYITGSPLDDIG